MDKDFCNDNINFLNCMDCGCWSFNRSRPVKCPECGKLNIVFYSCLSGIQEIIKDNKWMNSMQV